MHLFLLSPWGKCVQKAPQLWFWLPLQSFISARPVFPMMRAPTALVGMSQSPRPLIFNRSKAHPLTRTLQLVNHGPPPAPPPPTPGAQPGTGMQPSCLNETHCVPGGCGRAGVWGSALGGTLLSQDTLLAAESKACARCPNGFAFGGCCVLVPGGAPRGRLLMI